MSTEVLVALIALVSGGGLTGLIAKLLEARKQKAEIKDKEVDSRIEAWQRLSTKHEARIDEMEKKLDAADDEIQSLESYIFKLEQIIAKLDPVLTLPERAVVKDKR